jgi:hypothetical protein
VAEHKDILGHLNLWFYGMKDDVLFVGEITDLRAKARAQMVCIYWFIHALDSRAGNNYPIYGTCYHFVYRSFMPSEKWLFLETFRIYRLATLGKTGLNEYHK